MRAGAEAQHKLRIEFQNKLTVFNVRLTRRYVTRNGTSRLWWKSPGPAYRSTNAADSNTAREIVFVQRWALPQKSLLDRVSTVTR